ncbi:MAG: pyrimidine dimer DNA glycosylase/endonuclease V [Candidatus Woesearchaeota archaeon]
MRMWMVDPRIMCRKHLIAEHNECHMFIGAINKDKKLNGYIKNDCLEPLSIKSRHDDLVNEMKNRGYNHKTPIEQPNSFPQLNEDQINHKINSYRSLNILLNRCKECCKNFNNLKKNG